MNKPLKFIWIPLGIFILIFVSHLFGLFGSSSKVKQEIIEEIRTHLGEISVYVSATGVVEPENRLELKPPISGRVEKVLAKEGDFVKKGEILVWMSSTERAALLDAAISQGQEVISYWEQAYKPTPLVAPLDATVIVRAVEPGQTVTSADVVLVLADQLIVKAQIDETDIGQVKVGQLAIITLDAYPEQNVVATVSHIAYESKTVNNVTIYEVNIAPQAVPQVFRSGMTANVEISVAQRENILLLPIKAVVNNDGQKGVWLREQGKSIIEFRKVKTGISDNQNLEILDGLGEGDIVLIKQKNYTSKRTSFSSPFSVFGPRRRK